MKSVKMLTILFLTLVLCLVGISQAAPVGTAFTYQGRLTEDGNPSDGFYDFQFKLFDDQNTETANQVGTAIDTEDIEVNDGYFTVVLDFGPYAFDGNARWLEITVVQNEGAAPDDFVTLAPKQELTPTPYAIRAQIADKVVDALNGAGTTKRLAKFTGTKVLGDSAVYEDAGNVGIGTTYTPKKLTVAGGGLGVYPGLVNEPVIITDGYNVKLGDPDGIGNQVFLEIDDPGNKFVFNNGNVGIGITGPEARLHCVTSDGVGVHGESTDSYGEGVIGRATALGGIGVRGENVATGNKGFIGSSNYGVYGYNSSNGCYGVLGAGSYGVYGASVTLHGVYGSSASGYGVLGTSTMGHAVHGYSGGGYAGYFEGNVYVTKNVSALSFTDRTPYPKDLDSAYQAVMSIQRLPDGQYDENNKQIQLDHSKLSDFIKSDDGNRDLSATVSCQNEVIKDLVRQNKELKERLDAMERKLSKI